MHTFVIAISICSWAYSNLGNFCTFVVRERRVGHTCVSTMDYVSLCKQVCTRSGSLFASFWQALPGPLFNLSAYLGAVYQGVPGAFIGWLGLFGPGVSLIFGFLPFWGTVRKIAWFKVCWGECVIVPGCLVSPPMVVCFLPLPLCQLVAAAAAAAAAMGRLRAWHSRRPMCLYRSLVHTSTTSSPRGRRTLS